MIFRPLALRKILPPGAVAMALLACCAGSQGKSVMAAVGLPDRVDTLCFVAPVFFTLYAGILVWELISRLTHSCVISSLISSKFNP